VLRLLDCYEDPAPYPPGAIEVAVLEQFVRAFGRPDLRVIRAVWSVVLQLLLLLRKGIPIRGDHGKADFNVRHRALRSWKERNVSWLSKRKHVAKPPSNTMNVAHILAPAGQRSDVSGTWNVPMAKAAGPTPLGQEWRRRHSRSIPLSKLRAISTRSHALWRRCGNRRSRCRSGWPPRGSDERLRVLPRRSRRPLVSSSAKPNHPRARVCWDQPQRKAPPERG